MKVHWRLGAFAIAMVLIWSCAAFADLTSPLAISFSIDPTNTKPLYLAQSGLWGQQMSVGYSITNNSSSWVLDFGAVPQSGINLDFFPIGSDPDASAFAPPIVMPGGSASGTLFTFTAVQSFTGTLFLPFGISPVPPETIVPGGFTVNEDPDFSSLFDPNFAWPYMVDPENNSATLNADYAFMLYEPPNPIPEPGSLILLGTGLTGLASWMRRRARRAQDQ